MLSFLKKKAYSTVPNTGGWRILEPFSGAWQQNIEWRRDTVLANHAIFACITLIASDISKLNINRVRDVNGIWYKMPLGDYEVIHRPNNFQNRIQFYEHWVTSKLTRGNTYVLKRRNNKGIVTSLQILCPDLVLPLVTEFGDVYYQIGQDNLAGITEGSLTVPASEIIHDRFNCLFHPLVGLSPIFASGLAGYNGIKIQENSARHFQNMSRPSGILTAPGAISDETATRLKNNWEANYGGENLGRVAVLGDDLKYQALSLTAEQSQMVEQMRLTAEIVCSTFHVPNYKVIGDWPSNNNVEALEQQYYTQCLQKLLEDIELCLDEGLDFPDNQGTEFDLEGLLRMDTKTHVETLSLAVKGGLYTPNEARLQLNKKPLQGGDTVYMQEQYYSIEAISERDENDPFGDDADKSQLALPAPDQNEELEEPANEAEESANSEKFLALFVEKLESLYASA